jgi:alkylated DNA repair dioxygenase AlkB
MNMMYRYGVMSPMSPTIEWLRQRVVARTGVEYNHSVVLLYRNGDDCIGFHKDKTLDLDDSSPIVSISLGAGKEMLKL